MNTKPLPRLKMLPERPLQADELQALDNERLQPLIATLEAGLRSHWDTTGRRVLDTAKVWGVHAGLGQGKSTVIKQVIKRLQGGDADRPEQALRIRTSLWLGLLSMTRFCGCHRSLDVREIEASKLKSEHLDWKLLSHLVLAPLVLRFVLPLALWMAFMMGIAGAASYFFGYKNEFVEVVKWIWALPVVGSLLTALNAAWKWVKQRHDQGYLEFVLYRLARWCDVAPDMVVLDDLDRATVDQQRAVLRALVRHTHGLDCPLVVCFDETDLLASEPNPEAPSELLRKLIQVPLRLPPRGREDALLLAWGVGAQWLALNPERGKWAAFLLNPLWVAHLCQVLVLTESVGPRRAKSLVAEVLPAAQAWGALHGDTETLVRVEDASAFLLLAAIYQLQPLLRRDPELLLVCLEEGGDKAAYTKWIDHPRAQTLKVWVDKQKREAAQLQSLLNLADALLPVRAGWRALVLSHRSEKWPQRDAVLSREATTITLPAKWVNTVLKSGQAYGVWQDLGQLLDAIALGQKTPQDLGKFLREQVIRWSPAQSPEFAQNKDSGQQALLASAWPDGWLHDHDALLLCWAWPLVLATLPQLKADTADRLCRVLWEQWLQWAGVTTTVGDALRGQLLCAWISHVRLEALVIDDAWKRRLESSPSNPASFSAAKLLLRQPNNQVNIDTQTVWRIALGLSQQGAVAEANLMRMLVHGNLHFPPMKIEGVDPVEVLRRWPSAMNAGGQNIQTHFKALREWLPESTMNSESATVQWLQKNGFADQPWVLVEWLRVAEFNLTKNDPTPREKICADFDTLGALCEPNEVNTTWSFAHWRLLAPSVALPLVDWVREDVRYPRDWPVVLALAAQGWGSTATPAYCGTVVQAFVSKAQPGGERTVAQAMCPEEFACAALHLWARNAQTLSKEGVIWGQVPLSLDLAKSFLHHMLTLLQLQEDFGLKLRVGRALDFKQALWDCVQAWRHPEHTDAQQFAVFLKAQYLQLGFVEEDNRSMEDLR